MVKNPPAIAVDEEKHVQSLDRSFGVRNGNPLQYSFLENSTGREAWWAIVHGVAKNRTQLSDQTKSCHFPLDNTENFKLRVSNPNFSFSPPISLSYSLSLLSK